MPAFQVDHLLWEGHNNHLEIYLNTMISAVPGFPDTHIGMVLEVNGAAYIGSPIECLGLMQLLPMWKSFHPPLSLQTRRARVFFPCLNLWREDRDAKATLLVVRWASKKGNRP